MKNGLVCLFFLITSLTFSQTLIKGIVISNTNEPLQGASVYLNNTTIGTITDTEGNFELKIQEGTYTLVVSFLGFKTQQLEINSEEKNQKIIIKLTEDTNLLNEVVIKKIVYDDDWKYNLFRFKQSFLGRTKLASECKILNEKDIFFDYNYKTNTLRAFTKKPLQIKHIGLGYKISYDLIEFTIKNNELFFSGYAKYENLKNKVKKKWQRNRLEAYNGSQMHFLRSVLTKSLKEEGFVVNQFKRVENPERPSEEKIKFARELLKLNGGFINFSKQIENTKTPLDSAILIVQKAKLPKYRDYLYKTDVPYQDIFSLENNIPYLNFKDYLMVVYKNEPEELNYLKGMFGKIKKSSGVQTSNFVLLNEKSIIDKAGILEPGTFFNEGYWAFESFANMLPLDYKPQ